MDSPCQVHASPATKFTNKAQALAEKIIHGLHELRTSDSGSEATPPQTEFFQKPSVATWMTMLVTSADQPGDQLDEQQVTALPDESLMTKLELAVAAGEEAKRVALLQRTEVETAVENERRRAAEEAASQMEAEEQRALQRKAAEQAQMQWRQHVWASVDAAAAVVRREKRTRHAYLNTVTGDGTRQDEEEEAMAYTWASTNDSGEGCKSQASHSPEEIATKMSSLAEGLANLLRTEDAFQSAAKACEVKQVEATTATTFQWRLPATPQGAHRQRTAEQTRIPQIPTMAENLAAERLELSPLVSEEGKLPMTSATMDRPGVTAARVVDAAPLEEEACTTLDGKASEESMTVELQDLPQSTMGPVGCLRGCFAGVAHLMR